jgi:hypothetical protein
MAREWTFPKYDHLQDAVKRFFEILDIKEESEMSGREFHPNRMNFEDGKIDSCRVYNSAELIDLFKQMKILSGYRQIEEMREMNL